MELNRDEVRRQLKEADEAHHAAMKPWREALMRVFAGEDKAPEAVRAQLAGAPDRRSFLRIGGVTVAGAAVLAACGKDDDNKGNTTGTTKPPDTTGSGESSSTQAPTTAGAASPEDMQTDLQLLRTATSLELLAVAVYGKAAPLVKDTSVLDAAKLFSSQHAEHAKQLQGATKESFGADKVYDMANDYLNKNLVEPNLSSLTDDMAIVRFAMKLENSAASTYITAAGLLSTPELRQALMAIGGVEARHAAILGGVLKTAVPTEAFFSTQDTIPTASFISP